MKNRLLKGLFFILLLLAAAFAGGCATSPDRAPPPASSPGNEIEKAGSDPFFALAETYRLKGREFKKSGDLPKALNAWKVVKSFAPEDAEAEREIADLKNLIPAAAERHFQKGLALFKNHSLALARKEFLAAIYLHPDHPDAFHYLKEKLPGEDFHTYEIKKGETPKQVSQKLYGDSQKDFIIAYFNDLRGDGPLEFPRILKTPILNPRLKKGPVSSAKPVANLEFAKPLETRAELEKARGVFRENHYPESAALAEKILNSDATNREARELMNESYYQWGKQFGQEKKHREALEVFQRVDSGYKDAAAQLAQSRKEIAEEHYINGVRFFTQEEIELAIYEWEAALALEPGHPKAKKDIESARNVLQKLEKIK